MQQGVQTDATCNIQQCWELLANNVVSVCTGFYALNNENNSLILHEENTKLRNSYEMSVFNT